MRFSPFKRWFYRFMPDSLLGRTAVVLLLSMAVSLSIALILFTVQRNSSLSILGGHHIAERMSSMVKILEATPINYRRQVLLNIETPEFRVGWGPKPLVEKEHDENEFSNRIFQNLSKRLRGREIRLCTHASHTANLNLKDVSTTEFQPPTTQDIQSRLKNLQNIREIGLIPNAPLRLSISLNDGSWFNVIAPLPPPDNMWQISFVAPLILSLLVVFLVALWAVSTATRPFAVLAQAAERLGMDVNAPPLKEEYGSRDIRHAAHAFNVMQDRIRRFVEDRTRMLAAISHDLRTPITRLKLRAEFVEDDNERLKMLADLDEMERMIAATLVFARNDSTQEALLPVDLGSMIQGVVDDMVAMGHQAHYNGPEKLVTQLRPLSFKRGLLTNLIDNAIKYGTCANVSLSVMNNTIILMVEDHGTGIPEDKFEQVFAPFFRLEASRNRNTGGTGLGLSLVRAITYAHGGKIQLENRKEGGLRVIVKLPLVLP